MFVRPELRKGDTDLRIKAPKELVDQIDLISLALGVTRQDVALIALDSYCTEASAVARVLARGADVQRSLNGNEVAKERQ